MINADGLRKRVNTAPIGPEEIIWEGSPSQLTNLGYFLLCIPLTLLLGLGIILFIQRFLTTYCTRFKITNQRIFKKTGVFTRVTDEIELYRVIDFELDEPFFLRIFKLSNIILSASDKSHSLLYIAGVAKGAQVLNNIRQAVEKRRDEKQVIEADFY